MGCYEISLGDTLGVGVASDVKSLVKFLTASNILVGQLAGHFHDTYGQAVSNAWAAWECGVRVFDSSVSGLGGCPYAPGAKGNVATEDLVYMFQQAGISSGIDLASLVKTGVWISNQLSKQNESRAGNALVVKEKLRTSSSSSSTSTSTNPRRTSIAVVNLSWTSMKDEDGLEIHKSGPNVKITLNRPRNGNALTISMISNLTAFFENTKNDRFITRIAITARGKYFCTGMDLGKNSTAVSEGGSTSAAQFTRLTRLFEVIDNAPQVTVACIQGPAFGGGVGLAFACDVRIATKNASMTLSEVRLGLCPATISKYILREWGSGFAREAMLSGRVVSMDELVRLGVVAGQLANSEAELSSMLDDYLARLRAAAPRASSMCKDLVRLNWIDGGGQKQAEGIRALFDEMMAEKAEAAYGVEQFQGGNRAVDWDAYVRRKFASKL
jgi:hydroxymethylglutaryl-CoA lyase